MLIDSNTPAEFRQRAVAMAVYLLNRLPTPSYGALYKRHPSVVLVHPFGYDVHVVAPENRRTAFEDILKLCYY